MGASKRRKLAEAVAGATGFSETMALDTMGDKLHVKFGHSGSATLLGQLPFVIEFLQTSDKC